MEKYTYLVYLDCGHKFLREQVSRLPRPRLGAHEKCIQCGQVGTITSVASGHVALKGLSVSVEKGHAS